MRQDPQHVILTHYGLVVQVARQIHHRLPPSVHLEDLVSVGVIGLMESADRFDASRGVPFEAFARHRIRGAILDALRAADWVPHSVRRKAQAIERARRHLQAREVQADDERLAASMGLPLERYRSMARDAEVRALLSLDAPAANDASSPLAEQVPCEVDLDADTSDAQLRGLLREAVGQLPDRERQAIDLYYFQGQPLRDIGVVMGVSESRACQLCGQGIKRLRKRLQPLV